MEDTLDSGGVISSRIGYREELFILLTVCIVELFFADVAPFTSWDAVVFAAIIAIIYPRSAPYLIMIFATLQDSPGVSGVGWYVGTTLLGGYLILLKRNFLSLKINNEYISRLLLLSICVVVYAIIASFSHQFLGGYPQAETRSPLIVGGLMIFMMLAGVTLAEALVNEKRDEVLLILFLLLSHSVIVSLSQIFIDVSCFHSLTGIVEIHESPQLSIPNSLGIPRISGTYLTPNGWAYCNILLLLFAMRFQYAQKEITHVGALSFFVISIFFSFIAFSKALLVFSVLSSLIIFWSAIKIRVLLVTLVIGLLGLIYWTVDLNAIGAAFRLGAVGRASYRYDMWNAIVHEFSMQDWLFGVGIAYWPFFFKKYTGIPENDPHSLVFSVPGTFGILGVLLYLYLLFVLVRLHIFGSGFNKSLSLILLVLLFVKDLVSYPYFLGNTPLTLLIWGLLFFAGKHNHRASYKVYGIL